MSDTEWGRAKEIFGEALEMPREQHASFIEAVCRGDATLRARVEGLLAADVSAGEFMGSPSVAIPVVIRGPEAAAAAVGDRIGPYTLVRTIAEGGFGTVFEAEQSEPLRRRVALKVIKLGMDTRRVVAQFEQERQALAIMDHPNIAKVFDAGATPAGRPYFVMELIDGVAITAYCDRERLTPRERLELFVPVCQAVQHAHQKGIIHRDLKPSNVLVTLQDGKPVPKVIDFGIAKAIVPQAAERTVFTEQGQLIGTPEYMSPEQAAAGLDIDTRTDVYSLGVLLYELLTGATPFDPKELRSAAWTEMQRIIREVDPPKPSTRIARLADLPNVAACRDTEPRRLGTICHGDLDWIVMKCLEKDRARRYETANGLGADIRRHLSGEAVVAAPPSTWYRATRVVRRHKGVVVGSGLVAAAVLLGTVGTSVGLVRARAAGRAEARVSEFMADLLKGVAPSVARGRDTGMLKALLDDAAKKLEEGAMRDTPAAEVRLRRTIGRTYTDISEWDAAQPMLTGAVDLAKSTWRGDHEQLSGAMNDLGVLEASRDKLDAARPLFEAALAMYERLFSGDHPAIAESRNNLAYCIHQLGIPQEALPLFRESLAMRERLYGGDHAEVAESLNNVGFCLSDGGDALGGLPFYQAALNMRIRLYGGDHPDVAVSESNVAAALLGLNRAAEALPRFEAAAAMFRRMIPHDHPFTAQAIANVAFCLDGVGRPQDGLPVHRESLAMQRSLFPGGTKPVADELNNLGICLASLERYEESLAAHEEALAIRRSLKLQKPMARSLNNMGATLLQLGKAVEAERALRECSEMSESLWPDGNRYAHFRYTTMAVLGEAIAAQGRFAEAEPLLLKGCEYLVQDPSAESDQPGTPLKAARRLVRFYQAWDAAEPGGGHGARAAEWAARLAEFEAAAAEPK